MLDAVLGQSGREAAPHRDFAPAPGQRVYAIGDVHGEAALLAELLDAIDRDAADLSPDGGALRIVLIGDYVDRGPDSRGVIDHLMARAAAAPDPDRFVFLRGNHEMLMERFLFDRAGADIWLRNGGTATCLSYGIDPAAVPADQTLSAWLHTALRAAVPASHIAFLEGLRDMWRSGDVLFVHAGIRPGLPLEEQKEQDLHWIREPFLSSRSDHGVMVVHGHTPTERPEFRAGRIGIDTGAVYGGALTALALEGTERWTLSARHEAEGQGDAGIVVTRTRRERG